MNNSRHTEPAFGVSLSDIYFVIFRHKWKIMLLTFLGLVASGYYYFTEQPPYQSEAKLFIPYVSESHQANPAETGSRVTSTLEMGQNILISEMEILTSFDLAAQVATNVGPEKILKKLGGGKDQTQAAFVVKGNLKVEGSSSVIHVTYRHPDPEVVLPVLNEIVRDYLEKHDQVHTGAGISDEILNDQTTQLRLQIAQTDDELRMAKTNAGIVDVEVSKKEYADEMSKIRAELFQAKAQMAGRDEDFATKLTQTNSLEMTNIPASVIVQYKSAVARLSYLQKREEDYLMQQGYTEENKLVKEVRASMTEPLKIQETLEARYPLLASMVFPRSDLASSGPPSLLGNSAQSTSLPKRIKTLEQLLSQVQGDVAKLAEAENKISDLEHKKLVQENHYKYFADKLLADQINSAMGPNNISDIKQIQKPSPPSKDFSKFRKTIASFIFGGLLAGLGWAFLIEFYFDRSIKRPIEIETKLHIPFFLSIPDIGGRKKLPLPARKQLAFNGIEPDAKTSGEVAVLDNLEQHPWQVNHALDSHYDALRDRLVLYFESINLTRKPKLVAVTSTDRGAGVSTIAAGLAASLSETGDGRVLLVDMNRENGAAQQFFNGKPNCKLDDALIREKRDTALVQDRLYFVSEGSNQSDKLTRVLPKRFATLVPQLKASDYDYIIFDMPPVSQTSVTTRLAGFMDTVMLVIESEKTDRDVVQQASSLLAQSKANVTAVLNKTKKYVPARLQHDINAGI